MKNGRMVVLNSLNSTVVCLLDIMNKISGEEKYTCHILVSKTTHRRHCVQFAHSPAALKVMEIRVEDYLSCGRLVQNVTLPHNWDINYDIIFGNSDMKYLSTVALTTWCVAVVALEVHAARNDSYPELPIPVKECPHWFDIRTEYVANNFVNEKYQVSVHLCRLSTLSTASIHSSTSREGWLYPRLLP